jgi:hypothetical protein|tara:strand:+ start:687 stop:1919 length:1233 start_codon:yes stop_codon:yes gene_type:complete
MTNENENQEGYAVEGNLKKATKGYILFSSISSGWMRYEAMTEVAKTNSLARNQIPQLRTAKNAFAMSMQTLHNRALDNLMEAEGWDGPVKQSLQTTFLKRGNEYQVSIKREGMMNGKLHKESIPIVRLVFSPPENFNHRAWVENYMRSFWDEKYMKKIADGEEQRPEIANITRCINLETYWEETRVDPLIMNNIRQRVVQAFQNSVVSIDGEMLRTSVEKIVKSELNGINFLAGKGAMYVPSKVNEKETSETLDALANLVDSFKSGANIQRDENNYYDEDGNAIPRDKRQTQFRYLGYLEGARELRYIREDIGATLSQEIAEYNEKLIKVTESFNEEKVESFEKSLEQVDDLRKKLNGRIANICSVVGGDVPITTSYNDLNSKLSKRIANIPVEHNAVAKRVRNLAHFDN